MTAIRTYLSFLLLTSALSCSKAKAQAPDPSSFGDTWERYELFSNENYTFFKRNNWPQLGNVDYSYPRPDPYHPKVKRDASIRHPFQHGYYVSSLKGDVNSIQFPNHKDGVTPGKKRSRQPGCIFHGPNASMSNAGRIDVQLTLTGDFLVPPVSEDAAWEPDYNFPILTFQIHSKEGLLAHTVLLPSQLDKGSGGPADISISSGGKPYVLSLSTTTDSSKNDVSIRICNVSVRTRLNIVKASMEVSYE